MRTTAATWLLMVVCLPAAAATASEAESGVIRVAPTETLQEVIDAAPDGATVQLAGGTHRGPVTITRGLTLRGEPGARIEGGGEGSVLTVAGDHARVENLAITGSGRSLAKDHAGVLVTANHVTLHGLTLKRNLHGIYIRSGEHPHITDNEIEGLGEEIGSKAPRRTGAAGGEDDTIHHNPPSTQSLIGNGIHLFDADHAMVARNRMRHVRDGIYVAHSSDARFISNRVRHTRYGIHYMYSHRNTLEGNRLSHNVAGAALMFSRDLNVIDNTFREHGGFRAYGLLLQDVDNAVFEGNQMRANRVGLRLQNSGSNTFRNNRIVGNITGLRLGSASRDNRFTQNRIGPSLHQVELTGAPPPGEWSIDGRGNAWHGAMPMDLTGDGIGDWPHHEVDLLAETRQAFPAAQLLTGSPGVRLVEWALRRAPLPRMRYITDPHPIVRDGHHD